MFTILLILISLGGESSSSSSSALVITKQPEDKFALPGSSILFECQINDYRAETDLIEWCKNDFCTWGRAIMDTVTDDLQHVTQHRLRYKSLPRYFILTNATTTTTTNVVVTWNLLVENATHSDVGSYKCKVTRRTEQFVLKVESSTANLTIMDKPRSVQLSRQGPLELVVDGKPTTTAGQEVSCVVEGGVPAPDIYWILVDSSLINKLRLMKLLGIRRSTDNNIRDKEEEDLPFKSFHIINKTDNFRVNTTVIGYNKRPPELTYMSTILLNGTSDLIGKTLVCAVEHQLFTEPMTKSIRIDLKYSPILGIEYEPVDEPLVENKTFRFRCKSRSYPELYSNSSFLSLITPNSRLIYNISVNEDDEDEYVEIKLNRSMNGYILRCEKENEIGRSVLNYKLNVLYSPRFIETPEELIILNTTNTVDDDKQISLKCRADSNPESIIFWFRNGNELVHIGESYQVKSTDRSPRLDSQISCQAKSAGFEPITTKTSLITTGPPTLIGNEFAYSSKSNEITIQFTALSNPPLTRFGRPVCTRLSQNVSIEIVVPTINSKYSLDELENWANLNMSIRYVFRIKNPTKYDNGNYNCTLQNQLGSSHYQFEIRRREENGATFLTALSLTVFFVALISVLVLVIFALFCVYKKRHHHHHHSKRKTKLPHVSDLSSNCISSSQVFHNVAGGAGGSKSLIVNDLILQSNNGSKMNDMIVKSILPINNNNNTNPFDHTSSSPNNILNCNSLLSKQLNHISLIEQSNLESNSFSFESIPNSSSSDTQNLIFVDNSNKTSCYSNGGGMINTNVSHRQSHRTLQFPSILPPTLLPTTTNTTNTTQSTVAALLDVGQSSDSSNSNFYPPPPPPPQSTMIYSSRFQTNV